MKPGFYRLLASALVTLALLGATATATVLGVTYATVSLIG